MKTSRRTLVRLILVGLAALVMGVWYAGGVLDAYRVVGGSMATTLLGRHRRVICTECGFHFLCDSEVQPVALRAVCPNCGCATNDLTHLDDQPGDQLLASHLFFLARPPHRWEVVAFRNPCRENEFAVKRVVGLPGEMVEIRDGEVFIDGLLARKPLEQQKAMAVLVHDADYRPKHDPPIPSRWQPDQRASAWGEADGRFAHPADDESQGVDWLSYRHWRRSPGTPGVVQPGPILNDTGYSQSQVLRSEQVHPVADIMLAFQVLETNGNGELWVRAADGRVEYQARLNPARQTYTVYRDGQALDDYGLLPGQGPLDVEVLLVDCQFTLLVNRQVMATDRYVPVSTATQPPDRPVAIGSSGLGLKVHHLRVYRDVYYTCPTTSETAWGCDKPVQLGGGEYFVVGDNASFSLDSRWWPEGPGLAESLIIGKPFLVHFPARSLEWRGRRFQIPETGQIRYIR